MSNFRQVDRQTGFLLPPSIDEWLPERHLARFVVEVIDQLDLSGVVKAYRGSGSASYHPSVLLGLVVYGYATGVFSSRRIERASHDSVAFRFIAANDHPDHDTIATFRRRFLQEIEGLFVQVLLLARGSGLLKLGTVALDGTKIHANASRHSALSYEHASKIEAQLKAEVAQLLRLAQAADTADVPDGMSIPEELARREERLAAAKAAADPGARDQINLTDPESRIMPLAGGGFEQAYNAQATVATGSLLVVANDVVQAANDKERGRSLLRPEIAPMERLARLPAALGRPETVLADNGYFSTANVTACAAAKIAPLIAPGRDRHHRSWKDRFADAPPAPDNPTPLQAMTHRLASPEGRKTYALRKQTPEPVFGIIKAVMGFRQFLLRGLDKAKGEWNLVTLAWNVKRMFALSAA